MAKEILKLVLDVADSVDVSMPVDAKIVLVGHQPDRMGADQVAVWFETSDPGQQVIRRFHFYGTGHSVADSLAHVGSAICGQFVWHVYEAAG